MRARGVVPGLLVMVLASGCRGDRARTTRDEPATTTATVPATTVVPALPQSPDGVQELVALDLEIEQARTAADREALITALSRRAMLRGRHEDLREALKLSEAWTHDDKNSPRAWSLHISILTQGHQFAWADTKLDDLRPLAQDPSDWEPVAATLHEARGKPELAREYRERAAAIHPTATNLTNLAANLAMRGHLDAAIAMIPKAAAALRDPSPVLVSWLLVQWGRFHVQNGEPAAARQLFEEAHRRLPGYVEATIQLATATRSTGGDPHDVVTAALATEPNHPELLALAGKTAEAAAAWEVYLKNPLGDAYGDHAARFYLGAGKDPARAVNLARTNFMKRETVEARSLIVEAQLANAMWTDACRDAAPLATGARTHQFLAWRAFTACGQTTEAEQLAKTLGIR